MGLAKLSAAIEALFLAEDVLALIGAVFFVLRFVGRMHWGWAAEPLARLSPSLPDRISSLWRRLLVIAPEVLGAAAIFSGCVPSVEGQGWVIKVAVSLWVGYASQRAHKFLGQTILGDDPVIRSHAASTVARAQARQGAGSGERNDEG